MKTTTVVSVEAADGGVVSLALACKNEFLMVAYPQREKTIAMPPG